MQFKGTLGIRHFKDLEYNKAKLLKEVRQAFEQAYWTAIGAAVLDYGLHIPVVTGDTRSAVKEVLTVIDMRLARAGGSGQFASALDTTTITESKFESEDYPAPLSGNAPYKKPVQWPPDGTGPVDYVYNRREWANAIRRYGHRPEGGGAANLHYAAQGNQFSGTYTFYFSHGPDYWIDYDEGGIDGHGPWKLTQIFDRNVKELLDEAIGETAARLTTGILIVGPDVGVAVVTTPDYELGKNGGFGLLDRGTRKGKSYLPHLDLDFASPSYDDEVHF